MKVQRSISELLREGKEILKDNGIPEYTLDCQLLMMEATGFSKVQLFTESDYVLNEKEEEAYLSMINERVKKIPVQYITGRANFMDFQLKVNPNVLIPRPDTEILVETVLAYSKENGIDKIVDIGTGSGCIAISLNKYGMKDVTAVDISKEALKVAAENAKLNDAAINFVESDLLSAIPGNNKFQAIVSNPPYIVKSIIATLMDEVKACEPMTALDGGEDGLDFYRKIVAQSRDYLMDDGWIFFEIGYDQGESVSDLLRSNGYTDIKVIKDLAGLNRVVLGRKAGEVNNV